MFTVLSQSGNHMEHSIIAACISLLLGCSIQDNSQYTTIVRDNLPNLSFDPLVEVLQKLRDFAYLAVRQLFICIKIMSFSILIYYKQLIVDFLLYDRIL